MGVPSRTSAPTPVRDQTYVNFQIILGKVRPLTPPRRGSCRVGPPHYCGGPPSEPYVPVVPAYGSSKPRGRCGSCGIRWAPAQPSPEAAMAGGVHQVSLVRPGRPPVVCEIVGDDSSLDNSQPPSFPLGGGLRGLIDGQQMIATQRAAAV